MQNKIVDEFNKRRNFILYAVIGVSGIGVDLGIFFVLYNWVGVAPWLASLLSGIASIISNFTLNYFFNFKVRNQFLVRLGKFFLTALTGLLFMSIAVKIFGEVLGVNPNIVKVITLGIVVLAQYNVNKRVTFKD